MRYKMISLYMHDGIAYVWNTEDWYELRSNHRICGALIGSAPSYPRQNDYLGLPMALMAVETALLLEKGICELHSIPNLNEKPSEENKLTMSELNNKLLKEQMEALKKRKIDQISQKIDIIVAGKRKKLISKGMSDINLDKETLIQEEITKLPPLAPAHVLVHLPTEHHIDAEKKGCRIEDLNPSVLEGDGAVKYEIFKDLWAKGHYITDGMKFGCDFLVYPGDPVRFHAMSMVRCICVAEATFQPASLVAFGRLSVAVNKLAVLASCNRNNQINYQTLQWHDSVNG